MRMRSDADPKLPHSVGPHKIYLPGNRLAGVHFRVRFRAGAGPLPYPAAGAAWRTFAKLLSLDKGCYVNFGSTDPRGRIGGRNGGRGRPLRIA